MNVIEIFGKFIFDRSDLDKGLDEIDQKTNGTMSSIGNGLATAAKVTGAAIMATASGIGVLANQATSAYGEFQQLEGGIGTLFGEDAQAMMENASRAFATAGLSANQYMETAIQSSAAMINALGGDTAEAARLTDQSIIDMSDNVNKMGTTMEAVQNAYRGFSRGNFSMLDNLALGFSGTKEGMQELLDMAESISGVTYDIGSYADIVEAIHVVQENMGISGTTAEEAAQTITGSAASMKAAWENLMTGLADPNADLGALIDNMVQTASKSLENFLPTFSNALQGIGSLVNEIAPIITEQLPQLAQDLLPPMISAATNLITGLISALPGLLQVLLDQIPPIVNDLINTILPMLPGVLQLGVDVILQLANGISSALPGLMTMLTQVILDIVTMLTDPGNITNLVQAGVNIILAIVDGLIDAIPVLIDALPLIIDNIINSLLGALPILINGITSLVNSIAQKLPTIVQSVARAMPTIIRNIANAITQNLPIILQAVVSLVQSITQSLPEIMTYLVQMLPEVMRGIVDALIEALPQLMDGIVLIVTMIQEQLPVIIQSLTDAMPAFIDALSAAFPQMVEMIIDAIMALLPLIIDGNIRIFMAVAENLPTIVKVLIEALPAIVTSIVNGFGGIVDGVSRIFAELFAQIGTAISTWWAQKKAEIAAAFNSFIVEVVAWFEQLPYNIGVALAEIVNKLIEWKDNVVSWVTTELPVIINSIVDWFKQLPEKILIWLTDVIVTLATWGHDMIETVLEVVPQIIDSIVDFFAELPGKAFEWGKDMIEQFFEGIENAWNFGKDVIDDIALGFKDKLGHSHPKEGALADDYTWMPDMMDLFIQGIKDNEDRLQNQVAETFDFRDQIQDVNADGIEVTGGTSTGAPKLITPAPREVTVVLELDKTQFAKTVFQLNEDETQRLGVALANV